MKKLRFNKKLFIPLLVLALVVLSAGVWVYVKYAHKPAGPTVGPQTGYDQKEFDPKTDSEQAIRQEQEQTKPGPKPSPSPASAPDGTPATRASVKPIIAGMDQTASQIRVDALVDGQTSGTCTATLSRAGHTSVIATSQIVQVTSYYACQTLQLSKTGLAKGQWSLVVSFENASAKGSSDSQIVTVE